ncbi:MAG: VWA domain-containing protein [Lentisphaerae bacterium]|nr:VWA domain-containing protein [Lentisphaerota bacterium]
MTFVHPAVLIGLILGAIPIIVYYLMRFRSLRVPWGADYILERALARWRKKLYWDQIILLALRALVVMALVLAFARPQSRAARSTGTDGAVLRVLLVDGSYSMLAGRSPPTLFDASLEIMRELVSSWERGEMWSLYALDSRPRWVVDRAAVVDADHSRAILDTLKVEETAVSLAAGLKAVLAHGAGQRREIYIVADDQASNWADVDQAIADADEQTRVFWIHPPLADRRNLAVTRLEAGHERVLRGFSFPVYADVRNFSAEAVRDAELSVLVNGAKTGAKRVSLQPGQSVRLALNLRLDTAGPHLITARLSDDVLPFDNALSAGVEVAPAVSLLVLRDAGRTGKFESSAGFLGLAARMLAGGSTKEAEGPLRITDYSDATCALSTLQKHDAVVLDGGRTLTPDLAETLRQYVEQGGGLILAADASADLAAWRGLLGPANLLPAVPARLRNEALAGPVFRQLSRTGFDLPALRDFENDADGDLSQVRFFSWVECDTPAPGAETLARFDDGSTYAWRRRLERGSVLMLAAGLNSHNNNLLVRETVYPFLLHLFAEAASAGQYTRRVARNEPVRYLATGDPPPTGAVFGLDNAEPALASLTPQAQGMFVEYAPGSSRSGPASLLVLRENSSERIWIGVQGERTDSSLTAMAPAYREQLAETLAWTEAGSARELMDALEADGSGAERYGWVLLAVLLFAMGELLMGLRFV